MKACIISIVFFLVLCKCNAQVKSINPIEADSNLNGEQILYDIDSNVIAIKYYTKGYLNGKVTYFYSNGVKEKEGFFEMGSKIGTFQHWYKNGNLAFEVNYCGDKINGKILHWGEDGRLEALTEDEAKSVIFKP